MSNMKVLLVDLEAKIVDGWESCDRCVQRAVAGTIVTFPDPDDPSKQMIGELLWCGHHFDQTAPKDLPHVDKREVLIPT